MRSRQILSWNNKTVWIHQATKQSPGLVGGGLRLEHTWSLRSGSLPQSLLFLMPCMATAARILWSSQARTLVAHLQWECPCETWSCEKEGLLCEGKPLEVKWLLTRSSLGHNPSQGQIYPDPFHMHQHQPGPSHHYLLPGEASSMDSLHSVLALHNSFPTQQSELSCENLSHILSAKKQSKGSPFHSVKAKVLPLSQALHDLPSYTSDLPSYHSFSFTPLQTHWPPCCPSDHQVCSPLRVFASASPPEVMSYTLSFT